MSSDEELLLPDEELLPSDEEESSLSEEELFTLDDELDFSSSTPDEDEEFSELLEDSSCKELISGFGFAGVHESSSPQARNNAHAHATEVAKPSFRRFTLIPSPLSFIAADALDIEITGGTVFPLDREANRSKCFRGLSARNLARTPAALFKPFPGKARFVGSF